MTGLRSEPPEVAIIVPVWGQGPLLCEAITSILEQETEFSYRAILVDDACPHAETVDNCRRFARAHPDRILYWRSPENRGLAAMRNAGAEMALDLNPDLFAVISFDGDDRLHPKFLQRSVVALRAALEEPQPDGQRIGWVFEDPDHFGHEGVMLRTHRYSALWSMAGCANCPTSICSADIYRDGIRFREDMRSGSEDWQFWLTCLDRGYRGKFVPHLGFRYRRRPASMSAFALKQGASNKTDIRLSLPNLFHPDRFLAEEASELPRYIFCNERFELTVQRDAGDTGVPLTLKEYAALLHDYHRLPTASLPQYLILAADSTIADLRQVGLLDQALWRAEGDAVAGIGRLCFGAADGRKIRTAQRSHKPGPAADLICLPSALVLRLTTWQSNLDWLQREKRISDRWLYYPEAYPMDVVPLLMPLIERLRRFGDPRKGLPRTDLAQWRPFGLNYWDLSRDFFGVDSLLPGTDRKTQTVIVTDAEALSEAATVRKLHDLADRVEQGGGGPPSLLIMGAAVNATCVAPFKAVYFAGNGEEAAQALGILAAFGRVINFGSAGAVPLLNQIRAYGRRIIGYLPETDQPTTLGAHLQTSFKVFDRFVAEDMAAETRALAHGLSEEQLVGTIEHALADA